MEIQFNQDKISVLANAVNQIPDKVFHHVDAKVQ